MAGTEDYSNLPRLGQMRIKTEERWIVGDDGRVEIAKVDVYQTTGKPVFGEADKIFRTEKQARVRARNICKALALKFGLLEKEHQTWLDQDRLFKPGERVTATLGRLATVIGMTSDGYVVVELDDGKAVETFSKYSLTRVGDEDNVW